MDSSICMIYPEHVRNEFDCPLLSIYLPLPWSRTLEACSASCPWAVIKWLSVGSASRTVDIQDENTDRRFSLYSMDVVLYTCLDVALLFPSCNDWGAYRNRLLHTRLYKSCVITIECDCFMIVHVFRDILIHSRRVCIASSRER